MSDINTLIPRGVAMEIRYNGMQINLYPVDESVMEIIVRLRKNGRFSKPRTEQLIFDILRRIYGNRLANVNIVDFWSYDRKSIWCRGYVTLAQ